MTYLLPRWAYERITSGMTADQRAAFDREHTVYPDAAEGLPQVDQARIGAAYERLAAAARLAVWGTPAPPASWNWPKGNGKVRLMEIVADAEPAGLPHIDAVSQDAAAVDLPAPWEPLASGVWVAPAGTPPPDPADRAELDRWAWPEDIPAAAFGGYGIIDQLDQFDETSEARRFFLNQWGEGQGR